MTSEVTLKDIGRPNLHQITTSHKKALTGAYFIGYPVDSDENFRSTSYGHGGIDLFALKRSVSW